MRPRKTEKYIHFDIKLIFIMLIRCKSKYIIDIIDSSSWFMRLLILKDRCLELMKLMAKVLRDIRYRLE